MTGRNAEMERKDVVYARYRIWLRKSFVRS